MGGFDAIAGGSSGTVGTTSLGAGGIGGVTASGRGGTASGGITAVDTGASLGGSSFGGTGVGGTGVGGTGVGGTGVGGTGVGGTGVGGTGVGGTGVGGTGVGGTTASSCAATLIDDLEDGDAAIYTCGDRCGKWFVYALDPFRSMLEPPVGGAFVPAVVSRPIGGVVNANNRAATLARPEADGGGVSGMGLVLRAPGGIQQTVNLSSYDAVRFWYRTEGPAAATTELLFQVLLPETVVFGAGAGTCLINCNDHFSYVLPPAADWTSIDVPLRHGTSFVSGVRQRGFTSSLSEFQKERVIGLQFNVAEGPGAFKLHVDDIALVP
jgi:hypothetical protein